jgi:mannitol/fructose-specific phosphotransferase system IIA component (Ntr-type)
MRNRKDTTLMRLTEYIAKKRISASVDAKDKNHAIRQVAELLRDGGVVNDLPAAVSRVLERESYESCGIGHGVAIPHARCAGLKNLTCAVGRLKKPVDFISFDGEPVRLVFLILYSAETTAKYLLFVSSLVRALQKEEVREELLKAKNAAALHSIFEEIDAAAGETAAKKPAQREKVKQETAVEMELLEPHLVVRLQRLENLKASTSKKKARAIQPQIDNLRSCIQETTLQHFDKLVKRSNLAIVAAEKGMCQGCNMKLPSAFVQNLTRGDRLYTCPTCKRFLFFVGQKE